MKFNSLNSFDGKTVAKVSGNKIDAYDGSNLTGLKFTQLTDVGSPSGNKVLVTNENGDAINYVNMNFNAVKEIDITNQDSNIVTWDENKVCYVEHGLNGYVFTQVFDNNGDEIPLVKTYIDENHVSFYFENKPGDNEIYKLICVSCGYTLENTSLSKNLVLGPCSNLGFYINETNIVLSWTDPDDIMVNEAILAEWDKTVLVRKEGSYPTNPTDGTVLVTTSRSLINKNYYRDHSFIDDTVDLSKTYYYMLFSQTTAGTWNNLIANKFTSGTGLSWQQVGEFVEAGRGPDLFPVGTTFIVEHPEYTTSTGIPGIAFTVLGHDQVPASDETISHTMCLGMSEILFNAQYDYPELEYALTEDIVAKAGKIYYTYINQTYNQLTEGVDYEIGDNISILSYYEKNTETRVLRGYNQFEQSNIFQWANSNGAANQWFIKQNIWDTCNPSLKERNGFLKYIDPQFLSVIKEAKLINAKTTSEGGGSYIVNAKFWLLSKTQLTGETVNGIKENKRLSYYTNENSMIKQLNGIDTNWRLRSKAEYYDNITYNVNINYTNNVVYYSGECSQSFGISLACIVGKPNRMQYWKEVQETVRKGKGPERFPVGTIFVVEHPEYTHQDGRGLIFRVVGHNQVPAADETLQYTMCLEMVDCLFSTPYDVSELEYALTEDTTAQVGKMYYTLSGSTYTALTEGTDYDIGDPIPVASWYEKNLTGRSSLGSNNPKQNNLINWLNSTGSTGNSIYPMTIWDQCGTTLLNKNGFLKYIDPLFLAVVQPAKLTTALCTAEGGGSITHTAKFWQMSITQVFGTKNGIITENIQLDYYKNGGSKIKFVKDTNNPTYWWIRSPLINQTSHVYFVWQDGLSSYSTTSTTTVSVSPACIIG